MSNPLFRNLLAMEAQTARVGLQLHPKLRAALQAEETFPAHSSGPACARPEGMRPDIAPAPPTQDPSAKRG